MASNWPLLTGGRYSKVVVGTGLTAIGKIENIPCCNFLRFAGILLFLLFLLNEYLFRKLLVYLAASTHLVFSDFLEGGIFQLGSCLIATKNSCDITESPYNLALTIVFEGLSFNRLVSQN